MTTYPSDDLASPGVYKVCYEWMGCGINAIFRLRTDGLWDDIAAGLVYREDSVVGPWTPKLVGRIAAATAADGV